jgi:hypothetical protein
MMMMLNLIMIRNMSSGSINSLSLRNNSSSSSDNSSNVGGGDRKRINISNSRIRCNKHYVFFVEIIMFIYILA